MAKLTQWQREKIRDAILDHRFLAEMQRLNDDASILAVRIYDRAFTKKQRDLMATLPNGWLPTQAHAACDVKGDQYYSLRWGKDDLRPVPSEKRNGCLLVLDTSDPLAKALREHRLAGTTLDKARNDARRQISATLDSFSTVNALREGWPEIASFVEKVCSAVPAIKLPAPVIKELNATLKLPPKKLAA